jgi:hypothetical protein
LFFIPIVNIVFTILVWNQISKAFGHGAGFTAGIIFLGFIFVPILGFGMSEFRRAVVDRVPMAGRSPYV